MEKIEDNKWRKSDGTIITDEELIALHKKAPLKEAPKAKPKLDLEEGQSSGRIELTD